MATNENFASKDAQEHAGPIEIYNALYNRQKTQMDFALTCQLDQNPGAHLPRQTLCRLSKKGGQ